MKKIFYLLYLVTISNYAAETQSKANLNIQVTSIREYVQQWNDECFSKLNEDQKFLVTKLILLKIENEFLGERNDFIAWQSKFSPELSTLIYNYIVRIFYNNIEDIQKKFAIAIEFYKFAYGKIDRNEELIKPEELAERFKKVNNG